MQAIYNTLGLRTSPSSRARELGINISSAAREGVAAAVRTALAQADRAAYLRQPEEVDPFWTEAEGWTKE